jgi:oligosaccharide repeat unit polymerase
VATTRANGVRRNFHTGGLEILAGRVLFGLVTLALSGAVLWWNALGKPFGPGTSAGIAYFLFGLHVVLLFGRISPLDPLLWTPFALLLFYFGEPVVIEWLGAIAPLAYDPWLGGNGAYVDRGFAASALAVAGFLWGIHLAGVRHLASDPRRDPIGDRSLGTTAVIFTLGALAMVALGIAIVGPSVVFGIYSDWWDAKLLGADQRWIDMGLVFSNAGVFALLASDEPRARWRRWFAYLLMPLLMLIAIQKGDRTGLIALGVGAGWCYTQRIARMRWSVVLAAAFVALLAMPVISEWRAQRSLEATKRAGVVQLLGNSLYNMGTSVNALVYTLELIPREKGYAWGSTFLNAALQAIPNVSLTKGKEWAQGDLEDSPSTWITWVINPLWAATGGGYGYSMAAEWYYNFGPLGMMVGMPLTGFFLARVRNKARNSSLAMIWSATLFAAMTIWVRNIVGYALKVAVWPIIGIWVVHRLLLLLRGRARRRSGELAAPAPEPSRP